MCSQIKTLKIEMANELSKFYSYCGYEITQDQIKGLCDCILAVKQNISIEDLSMFLNGCKVGKYGMIYKTPISLMVAFQIFAKPKFVF